MHRYVVRYTQRRHRREAPSVPYASSLRPAVLDLCEMSVYPPGTVVTLGALHDRLQELGVAHARDRLRLLSLLIARSALVDLGGHGLQRRFMWREV